MMSPSPTKSAISSTTSSASSTASSTNQRPTFLLSVNGTDSNSDPSSQPGNYNILALKINQLLGVDLWVNGFSSVWFTFAKKKQQNTQTTTTTTTTTTHSYQHKVNSLKKRHLLQLVCECVNVFQRFHNKIQHHNNSKEI